MSLLARVFIGCALIFSVPSWGQGLLPLIIPSPLTIALTAGQWLMRDSQKAYYVRVESTAPSPAQARAEGFKLAVSQAVGTLIVAESEVKNQQLVRSEIVQYSSGYIQDFKIISETSVGSMTRIVMDVWVTESKIADRLLNVSKTEGTIEGEKSAVQLQSNLNQLASGDKILQLILNDFPYKAFDLKAGKSTVTMPNRSLQIQIPASIAWNKEYISSLTEALERVRQGKKPNYYSRNQDWASVIEFKSKSDWFMSYASFRDNVKFELLMQNLIQSEPRIKLILKDDSGNPIIYQCFEYQGLTNKFYSRPGLSSYDHQSADFGIYGSFSDQITLDVELPPQIDQGRLAKITKVDLSVVRGKDCR